jgi:succinate dehydrogenase / fumarate reductase cytochrome b subunit
MQDISTSATAAKIPVRVVNRSIGKKLLMSITGFIMLAYVIGHLIGNMQIYIGQNALNQYAVFLKSTGGWLWFVRGILVGSLIIHVWMAITLYFENNFARPINYRKKHYVEATLSSRTMIWTGIGVFLFVGYHLLQFTIITTNPQYAHLEDPMGRHDVYSMVILAFRNPLIFTVYVVSLAIISYHIVHAAKSMFQTWGLNDNHFEPLLHTIVVIFTWILFLCYISIPISVLTGAIKLPEGVI